MKRFLTMHPSHYSWAIGLVLIASLGQAQDCNNPVPVCGDVPEAVSLNYAQNIEFGCLNSPYVTVLEFMTNTNVTSTGPVYIDLGGVACQTNGVDDVIECVVIKPDPQALCDAASYQAVSPCSEMGGATSLQSEDLLPNTTYLILLGTAHDPSTTPCNLTVFLSGPAVSIDACCTTNIAPGQSVELTASGADEALGYTWFPDFGLSTAIGNSVVASPSVTTTYSVSGFFGGCQYSDAVTITVGNPLGLPTSFTPNDDGYNDTWDVDGLLDYNLADIRIFDRWGQVVFRSVGYSQPWNGMNGGKAVPVGTYYYAIDLNDPLLVELETITGFISIIR